MSDKYLWLEDLESRESRASVTRASQQSEDYFQQNKYFETDKLRGYSIGRRQTFDAVNAW